MYSDKEIIAGCQRQKEEWQKRFVDTYSPFLFATCLRYISSRDIAEDCLQEVLIKILNNISSFDQKKGVFKAWIKRITINHCLNKLKQQSKLLHPIVEQELDKIEIEASAFSELTTKEIMKVIQKLPEVYRVVFNMFVIDGYTHEDISNVLKIENATSRTRLRRAKAILRHELTKIKTVESWMYSI